MFALIKVIFSAFKNLTVLFSMKAFNQFLRKGNPWWRKGFWFKQQRNMNVNFDPKVCFWHSRLAQMSIHFSLAGVPRDLNCVLHTVKEYLEED